MTYLRRRLGSKITSPGVLSLTVYEVGRGGDTRNSVSMTTHHFTDMKLEPEVPADYDLLLLISCAAQVHTNDRKRSRVDYLSYMFD